MSHDPIAAPAGLSALRRRVLSFSMLSLIAVIVALSLFKPSGIVDPKPEPATADYVQVEARLSGADIGWRHTPQLFFIGMAAGLLSGMLGMGGGVLKICFMLLFLKLDIFFARAIAIATMFFSSAAAAKSFIKADLVMWRFVAPMLPMAVPAGILAAVVGNDLSGATLTHIFAIFVIFLAFNTLAFTFSDPTERMMVNDTNDSPSENQGYYCAAIGGLHGATSGLLGISGGVISTPLQQLVLHIPMRRAIANTLVISTAVTFFAGLVVLWSGVSRGSFTLTDVLFVDLFMGTGAALGAPIGAYFGQRFNTSILRLLFVLLTLIAGLSILS